MPTITNDQLQRIRDICEDVTGCLECNCGDGCEGTCTFAMATALAAELPTQEAAAAPVEPEPQEAAFPASCEACGNLENLCTCEPDCPTCGKRNVEPLDGGAGAEWECYDCGETFQVAPTQEVAPVAQEAAPARYEVRLHSVSLYRGERVSTLYMGGDETVMYSHVSAIEVTLVVTSGTAEIEIVEDGQSRWIDYQEGLREGMGDQSQKEDE